MPVKNFQIDRNSSLPLHRQVEAWLRQQIESGGLAPGESLPPRKEFSEMLGGINHLTIRQAVSTLAREGLLFSVQGRGTFVAEQKTRQLSIGVVLPNIDDEFTHSIASGVQEYFEAGNKEGKSAVRTVLFDSRRDAQKEIDNIAHLQDLPLDGAIILPVGYGNLVEHLVRLKVDHFPLVLVDSIISGIEFPSVASDNYNGGYLAAKHLLERGRTRLAWIGNCSGYFSARQRFEGFRDAINDGGHAYNRQWLFEHRVNTPTAPLEESMQEIVSRIVAEKMPLDGIICANDIEAIACLRLLQEKGVEVPGQIAVVGFDDIRDCTFVTPALTTIRQPMKEIGREAARLLLESITKPEEPLQNLILPVTLIQRSSS